MPDRKPMTDTQRVMERRRAERREGVVRGKDFKETSTQTKLRTRLAVRQKGDKWQVYNEQSDRVIYEASTQASAVKKLESLVKGQGEPGSPGSVVDRIKRMLKGKR